MVAMRNTCKGIKIVIRYLQPVFSFFIYYVNTQKQHNTLRNRLLRIRQHDCSQQIIYLEKHALTCLLLRKNYLVEFEFFSVEKNAKQKWN